MRITKRSLAVRHCASTDETRKNLVGVNFESDGVTVATDGHVVAWVTPGLKPEGSIDPFTLSSEAIKPVVKVLTKRRDAEPMDFDVQKTNANGTVALLQRGANVGDTIHVSKTTDVSYPNWRQIEKSAPRGKGTYRIALSVVVLEMMIKAAREFAGIKDKSKCHPIRFNFPLPDGIESATEIKPRLDPIYASVMSVEDDGEDTLEFLVMPMKWGKKGE